MWFLSGKMAVIFPVVAFLLNNFVGAYVYAQHNRTRVNRTFLIFTWNAAGWLGAEFLFYFPVLEGYEMDIWRLSSIFWISSGFWYVEFANAIAGQKRNFVSYLGAVTAVVGYGISGFTDWVFIGVEKTAWGTLPVVNVGIHLVMSANTAIFTTYGMFVLAKKSRTTNDDTLKKIIYLILPGTIVAAMAITLLNVILPNVVGIRSVPQYGASAMAVFMVLVFYAIMKYRFLAISPQEVAEEIYEEVAVGILLIDSDGLVSRLNREASILLGNVSVGEAAKNLFDGYDISGEFESREVKKRNNGKQRVLLVSASRVVHSGQPLGTILMLQDITAQKKAEAVLLKSRDELEKEVEKRTRQLRRAQRMETIGTLAGGIAHDFNNSLAAILGFSKAALMDLPEEDPIRQDLTEVILAANRGKDMVHQIMTLSRKENKSDFKVTNISSLLEETIKLLQISTPDHISVRRTSTLLQPFVNCSSTQLSQVIMNLYTNACYAMKDEADAALTISLDNVDVPESEDHGAGLHALRGGEYVRFTLRDTGTGISPTDLQHIFDPFFTTKTRDEGTGLGLSSAQVIMNNHDGEIAVESALGEGTSFTLFLPVHFSADRHTSAPPPMVSMSELSIRDEHILWVDDKPQILRMGKRMLSQFGYRVTTAVSGVEALEMFGLEPKKYCLIITDYSMPEMTGTELAKALRKVHHEVPIILVSGFGDAVSDEELATGGITAFLNKPLEAKDLSHAIRSILDGEPNSLKSSPR